jgi:hypothetical protein
MKTGMALPERTEITTWKPWLRTQEKGLLIYKMYKMVGYTEIRMI